MIHHRYLTCLLLGLLCLLISLPACAQYSIPWWTVAGGGGQSSGGDFSVTGTIGQSDAGVLQGGALAINGGFWHGGALPVPSITSFTPESGEAGTTVTITGSAFTGATAVTFGGTAALGFAVYDDNTIFATVASGATGTITVTTPGGTATSRDIFTFIPPAITSFDPSNGGELIPVFIYGTAFTGTTAVTFGGTPANYFYVQDDSTIVATVDVGSTGVITVTTPGGTATSTDIFTFFPAPVITGFTPTSGVTGTVITITGANFTGANMVAVGPEIVPFTVLDDNTITATVTNTDFGGALCVYTTYGYGESNDSFILLVPPVVNGFTPWQGEPGTVVTIYGSGFTGATDVTFGDMDAAGFTVIDDGTIQATVPDMDTGPVSVPISVTTALGTGVSPYDFSYLPTLTITGFSPTSGPTGTTVLITGASFSWTSDVSFGGTDAANFTILDDDDIQATVGDGASGPITVTTLTDTVTSIDEFTFYPTPAITGFSPESGGMMSLVTITGAGFTGATAVAFGGTPANDFGVQDDGTIYALVDQGSTGVVTVTTPGGTATSTDSFTFIPSPVITGFTPTSGVTGTLITITGYYFTGSVFGGRRAGHRALYRARRQHHHRDGHQHRRWRRRPGLRARRLWREYGCLYPAHPAGHHRLYPGAGRAGHGGDDLWQRLHRSHGCQLRRHGCGRLHRPRRRHHPGDGA